MVTPRGRGVVMEDKLVGWEDFLKETESIDDPKHVRMAKDRWRTCAKKEEHKAKKGKK